MMVVAMMMAVVMAEGCLGGHGVKPPEGRLESQNFRVNHYTPRVPG